jgi:hypothetical protein
MLYYCRLKSLLSISKIIARSSGMPFQVPNFLWPIWILRSDTPRTVRWYLQKLAHGEPQKLFISFSVLWYWLKIFKISPNNWTSSKWQVHLKLRALNRREMIGQAIETEVSPRPMINSILALSDCVWENVPKIVTLSDCVWENMPKIVVLSEVFLCRQEAWRVAVKAHETRQCLSSPDWAQNRGRAFPWSTLREVRQMCGNKSLRSDDT